MGGEGGGKGSLGSRGFSPLSHNFCINNYMMEPNELNSKKGPGNLSFYLKRSTGN